jgi:serine/threonine protein phosphatase PrpC
MRQAVANVGDSSAVACCDDRFRPILLTVDHTPYNSVEYQLVVEKGGFIEEDGVLRVNGSLAVTRSLGDRAMDALLGREPSVSLLDVHGDGTIAVRGASSSNATVLSQKMHTEEEDGQVPRVPFLIVASDGLWDVLSPADAVNMVMSELQKHMLLSEQRSLSVDFFEDVARLLAVEAFVRGSMDNIGVCVVQLSN